VLPDSTVRSWPSGCVTTMLDTMITTPVAVVFRGAPDQTVQRLLAG
jgi:hypothetical protein